MARPRHGNLFQVRNVFMIHFLDVSGEQGVASSYVEERHVPRKVSVNVAAESKLQ